MCLFGDTQIHIAGACLVCEVAGQIYLAWRLVLRLLRTLLRVLRLPPLDRLGGGGLRAAQAAAV